MKKWIKKQYIPNSITLTLEYPSFELQQLMSSNIFSLLKGKEIDSTNSANFTECVYICKDFACSLPMYSVAELKNYLNNNLQIIR
jgi:hypothetical protein